MAYKASSRRSETPNLSKMLCRWFFTVCSLINIFSAISLFLKPCATKATISRSLWLSRERSRSRLLETGVPAAGASSAPVANCRMTTAVVCESNQLSPAFTLRMLLISRSVALCFKTMPEVPSFMACTNSFLSSEAVSTMTRVLCLLFCSLCSVARPSRPGILRSSSRISGSCCCSTSSTCRPSCACATTSKSGSRASSRHKPSRNIGWSSATTMRIFLGSPGAAGQDASWVPLVSGINWGTRLHFRGPVVLSQSYCSSVSHFLSGRAAARPGRHRPKLRNRLLVSPMSTIVAATTLALPSPPAKLAATPVSTSGMGLTWSAGPSGMPITGYYIFRGTSPSSLTQAGTTAATAYSDYSLTPGTTYYYAVEEFAQFGNVSPMSAVVPATTLALPSPPAMPVATPITTAEIGLTWSAGPSGMPIAGYYVFRGTSRSNLTQVGTWTATTLNDYHLAPATTYYYAVEEVDKSGNVSPMSAVVAATTLTLPTAPAK